MVTARIKCMLGEWICSTGSPSGKKIEFVFTAKNDYTVDVPKELQYKDDFGKTKTLHANYPQHLMTEYGMAKGQLEPTNKRFLKLLEIIVPPQVEEIHVQLPKAEAMTVSAPEATVEPVLEKLPQRGRPRKVQVEEGVPQ